MVYCAEASYRVTSADVFKWRVVILVKWCVLMRTFKVHKTLRVFIVSVVMSRLMYVKRAKKSKIWVKTWKNEVFVYMSLLTACRITKQKNLKKWIFLFLKYNIGLTCKILFFHPLIYKINTDREMLAPTVSVRLPFFGFLVNFFL